MNRSATFRHEVQFYSSDSALLESFARFIRNALKSHTAVVVLATKPHRESLVQRLSGEDFDIDCAMQHGMYISLDAVEMLSTIMVNGIPDRLRFFEGLCGLIESAASKVQTTLDLYAQEDSDETRAAQGEYLMALGVGTNTVQ